MSGALQASDIAPGSDRGAEWLRGALGLDEGKTPFPWQIELLRRFLKAEPVSALDIPTGLGKTAAMAVWLVARALGASLPRRLVYVVDRRVVVDQATEVAGSLRAWVEREPAVANALGLDDRSLSISTLRGQHVDNREWLDDPSLPAIVVGTIDMIGSRLLFSGYGISSRMRAYHAGLLGADTLVVLDEAHLVPAFEDLILQIERGAKALGPTDPALRALLPGFAPLSLSATGRQTGSTTLTLTDADRRNPTIWVGNVRLTFGEIVAGPILLGRTRYLSQRRSIAPARSRHGAAGRTALSRSAAPMAFPTLRSSRNPVPSP